MNSNLVLQRQQPLILLVDDNLDNLLLIIQIVQPFNCGLLTAENGRTALALAQTERPDLILLDIALPDVDGMTVAQELRRNPETSTIPIIAVTALAKPEDREQILEAGCNEYLSKPYELEALEALIQKYLGVREMGGE
ncbi:MAG: response regulator [Leptolyngbyaceae cyanobacterium bins.59]|nr:response regulator [Leptolyngbyaceae cyanobacterium bins.59]